MDKSTAGLALAVVDTAAIIGVGVYLNNKINELKTATEVNNRSIDQIGSYIKANIDPKALVGLGERLSDHESQGERIDHLESVIASQNKIIKENRDMIQSLIDALDRANIRFDVPDNVKFEEESKPMLPKGDHVERSATTQPSRKTRILPPHPTPTPGHPPTPRSVPVTLRRVSLSVPPTPASSSDIDEDVLGVVASVANS